MKKVAILQSNYIPWKGYFDLINSVDEFILFDCVQYTRSDWRNRNKLKTRDGTRWLTVPVSVKGKFGQSIADAVVSNNRWSEKHFKLFEQEYSKAPFFRLFASRLQSLYEDCEKLEKLSAINRLFIGEICEILGIKTIIRDSSEFELADERSEKLLSICQDCKADVYVSGPAAKSYLDLAIFEENNVRVDWFSYDGYPEYPQLHPPFEHAVTIYDLLFNTGHDANHYLLSF